MRECPLQRGSVWIWAGLALCAATSSALAQPSVTEPYRSRFVLREVAADAGPVTQMAWGPDGRLYASRSGGGAISYAFNPATGALTDQRLASTLSGLGIAFRPGAGEMYQTSGGAIWRLDDTNGNGTYGEAGETRVSLVRIPTGDHDVDQLQIRGDTLYVGIGQRTSNGTTGPNSGLFIDDTGGTGMAFGGEGNTFGESAYNGTISWIRDLSAVASTDNAAALLGDFDQATIQTDASPLTSTDPGKLTVHSSGTRNPYGLALDPNGDLFFTNNHNRANTNGDGTATVGQFGDALDSDFSDDVHDQFFKAVQGGDYGFRNDNWRGVRDPSVIASILDPTSPDYQRVRSITPDTLYSTDPNYLQLHDPANPVGLGPHASANGVDFWTSDLLPPELRGRAFITRFNASVAELAPGTDVLNYADLVAVDPATGEVRRIAAGFDSPLAVLSDGRGNLLISDYGSGRIYALQAVPEPSSIALMAVGVALGMGRLRRGRGRRPGSA